MNLICVDLEESKLHRVVWYLKKKPAHLPLHSPLSTLTRPHSPMAFLSTP